ncbi:hypothetical protein KGA66_16580 [Actinocrinis puniceicyclus]|uniref:ABC transporter n=1 Tax=Actinocrinis puniceicyclus TaxID=977794 RepID=A0A8J8BDN9_9ACTN|nr:hypothetical protein [Actinocrinis puniceicyclus]MBS2964675.1 hypothetical protein [Actinocrinis puniceicyclus]
MTVPVNVAAPAKGRAIEPVIVAEQLTKTFTRYHRAGRLRRRRTDFTAVDCIDLRVEPGELVGYIGPNGAGKSTTVIPDPYTYSYGY